MNFDEIKAYHEKGKAAGFYQDLDLAQFSQEMQQKYPDRDWSQGLSADNWVGSMSRGIDTGIKATGLPDLASNVTGFIGQGVDSMTGRNDQHYEQIARGVGQGLPRMAADVGMMIGGAAMNAAAVAGAPATGGASLAALAPGTALMGAGIADAGVKGYADTGSVKQGVTSAGMMALAPGIGSVGSKVGLKVLGKVAPKALYSGGARVAASQLGQETAFMGADVIDQTLNGHNPFTMDNLFANAVGTVGFAPLMVREGMDVYKSTPKAAGSKTWTPTLGADQSVRGGGTNDPTRVLNYILQGDDAPLPTMLHEAGGLRQALELTGLDPVGLNSMEMGTLLGQRRKAKELIRGVDVGEQPAGMPPRVEFFKTEAEANAALATFPEGSVVQKTGGDVAVLSAEWDQLSNEASQLLMTDQGGLVDLLKIMQVSNKFAKKFADQQGNVVKPGTPEWRQKLVDDGVVTEGEAGLVNLKNGKYSDSPDTGKYSKPAPDTGKFGVEPAETGKYGQPKEGGKYGTAKPEPKVAKTKATKKGKAKPKGYVEAEQFELPGFEERSRDPQFSREGRGPLADSNVFRFVKGPLTHDGSKFLMLGSAQIPASGLVHQNRFQSATQMPKQVFELVKQVYPEAFEGESVNVNKLRELEQSRPLVETHVYGQDGAPNPAKAARDQMMHEWYDNQSQAAKALIDTYVTEGGSSTSRDPALLEATLKAKGVDKAKLDQWLSLSQQAKQSSVGPRATSYYNTISPFDTTKYPVVRIDVTVPGGTKPPERSSGDLRSRRPEGYQDPLWHQDDLHENLPNTLGWAMVQFVPDPRTGETVMFVAEQQSRWGQDIAARKRQVKNDGTTFDNSLKVTTKEQDHPLLDLQHKLVLKAAMDEARKRGVTKMVVSDGETAMMTEGHDTASVMDNPLPFNEGIGRDLIRHGVIGEDQVDYARRSGQFDFDSTPEEVQLIARIAKDNGVEWTGVQQPSQAGGMRQHYDSVLQSAAEKMTRSKGESVDMGVHKNAMSGADGEWAVTDAEGNVISHYSSEARAQEEAKRFNGSVVPPKASGSPVFRNADGTPKTTATGKMYDIPLDTDNIRYSKVGEPTGANPKGVYTAETLRAETERLNNIEATPDMAVARLKQKIVNKLTRFMGGTVVDQNNPAMRLMSETFDNLGLSTGLKSQYMKAAQRIVDFIEVGPARYGRTEVFTDDPTARGVYFGADHLITIKSTPGQSRNAEAASYNALRVLAHESSHALHDLLNTGVEMGVDSFRVRHLSDAMDFAKDLTPQDRAELLYQKFEELMPGVERESFKDVVDYSAQSAREFLTEYGALHAMGKTEPSVVRNALRFVPEPLQNFVKTLLRGMHDLAKAVRGVKGEQTPFEGFQKNVEMLYAKDPVIEGLKNAMVSSLQGASAIERGDIAGVSMDFSKSEIKVIRERVQEHLKVRQSNGFVRNVMQHAQIAAGSFYKEHFPAYQKLVSALTTMDGMAVALNHSMRKGFMISVDGGILKELSSLPDSKLTQAQIQMKSTIGRIEASPKLQRVAFDTMLKTNELVKQSGETQEPYPTFDSPEIQAILDGLNPQEKADIRQTYEAYLEANKIAANLQISTELRRFYYVAADYLLGGGMPHDQALTSGRQLMDSILSGDPRNMAQWDAVPGAAEFAKHWENVKPRFEEFQANLDRPYFTEFRSGNYGVRYEVLDAEGKVADTGYRSTNDPTQFKAIQTDVARDPKNRIIELMDHRKDPKGRFGQMQTRGLEEATNLVRAHYDAAMSAMRPEMAAMFEDAGFDPAQPLISKVNSDLKTMALRRFAPGREKINMIAAQDAYSSLIARKLANTAARLESNWLMKHESWDGDKHLKQEMQLFRDSILSAGRQEHQAFRKATTMVMMGANVSSAIVDSLQPITMGLWRVTQEVGFKDALKYTAEGFREAFKPIDRISDAGFKTVLVEAINRGLLKTGGSLDSFMSSEDTINYNVVKAQSNRDLVDMARGKNLTDSEFLAGRVIEQFSKLGQKGMELGMTPMRLSAQLNNKNSLWVGYRMGQKKGLKGQELFNYAVQTMQTINLQGQRAAHSSFKTKAGSANGLVEAATLMTNYPIAVFAEMVSSWQGMLKSSGLDKATRTRSMHAFAGQVLTQMAFAGVAGMGLKGVFEIARQWFGVDVEDEIRKATAAIDESGTLGEVLLNGVANTVTGADLSSRFDLSGLGGLNPYTGFDAKGLFGAGGGMISSLYNAPSQFAKGDMSKVQLIPTGVRRMMTAWGDDAYKDSSGQQVINPTTSERFVQMIGFKPARMSKVLEQKNTMRNISTAVSEQSTQRKSQQVQLMQQGKMPEVMQMIQQDVLEEMQGPEFAGLSSMDMRKAMESKTRETMMELVNYGVEKLLPFDPMSTGSGIAAQEMNTSAQGFGDSQAPRQSEATRTVLKQQMMSQLGLKLPRGAPRAVRTAQMVDELIRQNPLLTRSQAIALLRRE